MGDEESASNWRELFKEEFPKAKVHRCQVHVAKNVLAKVPRKLKQAVADDMRSIFMLLQRQKRESYLKSSRRSGQRSCLQR